MVLTEKKKKQNQTHNPKCSVLRQLKFIFQEQEKQKEARKYEREQHHFEAEWHSVDKNPFECQSLQWGPFQQECLTAVLTTGWVVCGFQSRELSLSGQTDSSPK